LDVLITFSFGGDEWFSENVQVEYDDEEENLKIYQKILPKKE
jgi:hypothetical protein